MHCSLQCTLAHVQYVHKVFVSVFAQLFLRVVLQGQDSRLSSDGKTCTKISVRAKLCPVSDVLANLKPDTQPLLMVVIKVFTANTAQ